MITAEMTSLITTFPLGFVATQTPDGLPAVSPKGTFVVLDDKTIAFGHIRSPGTMRNLAANPHCEVNFIDVLKRKGVRLRGEAQIHPRGEETFERLIPQWEEIWGDLAHRVKALVIIKVTAASGFTTPPYDDGATEEEMIAAYKAKLAGLYS